MRWARKKQSHCADEKTQEGRRLAQEWGWGALASGPWDIGCSWTVTGRADLPSSPVWGEDRRALGTEESGPVRLHLLPAGSSFPCRLWGNHTPLLDLTCFEHGPLVFSPPQRQVQLTAALSTRPAQHSWPSPLARLSSPRRSPVTGQGAKSLFAEYSLSQVHFLLALPLRTRLRAHSQGSLWGHQVVSAGRGGGGEAAS